MDVEDNIYGVETTVSHGDHQGQMSWRKDPESALHKQSGGSGKHADAAGRRDSKSIAFSSSVFTISGSYRYRALQSSLPPTLRFIASLSSITPLLVDTTAISPGCRPSINFALLPLASKASSSTLR